MWDLGQRRATTALVAALLAVLLLSGACSGESSGDRPRSEDTTGQEGGTPASLTTVQEKTEDTSPERATLGKGPGPPGIVLRLEGDPKTTFSGICTVRGKESVLSGRVPKRYAFRPRGQKLSCRIQKQDSGRGSLKVILTANDTTRSVQQTNTSGGVIHLSHAGG